MRRAVVAARRHGDLALGGGVDQPQHRGRGDHHQGGRVGRADGGDDQRQQRGVAPRLRVAASTVSPTIQPRPAHGSSIADVRDTYGRTYGESWYTAAAASAAGEPEPEAAGRPQHPGAGQQEQRADPQPVGHPVWQADGVAQPVPGPLGPQVGDRLVRHPSGELAPVERPRGVGDQPAGVQVEVQLGIGRHPPGRRAQGREVGDQRQEPHRQTGGPESSHGPEVRAGRHGKWAG